MYLFIISGRKRKISVAKMMMLFSGRKWRKLDGNVTHWSKDEK